MTKKKKKHKPCSYLQPSVDGRRKTTIKQQKDKELLTWKTKQFEKMADEISRIVDGTSEIIRYLKEGGGR